MDHLYLSDDEYLLSKSVHKSSIKRIIDWKSLNITKETISEANKLKHSKLDEKARFIDARKLPKNEKDMDTFYIIELCLPYNPEPDDRDIFLYYNDIRALSGTAGYLRIRDGYVWGSKVVMRS